MPRKRLVGLSAGEAVLGLVIEQPDSASRLGSRLVERFRSAQFTRSTAHNALSRLARQGLVRVVADEDGPEDCRYEATPLGVEHFRAWLCASSVAAPALREELHAKVEFCTAADLPQLIEAICAEERACASMFAAAQGRLSEAELVAPRCATAEQRWSALARRAVLRDEAALWGTRFKRLERLRARLEELGEVAVELGCGAVAGTVEGPGRHEALHDVAVESAYEAVVGTVEEPGRREAPRDVAVESVRARSADPARVVGAARVSTLAVEPLLGRDAPPLGTTPSAHALGGRPTHVDDPPR
jgi:DNA-binding PadR family transcriptional regulator